MKGNQMNDTYVFIGHNGHNPTVRVFNTRTEAEDFGMAWVTNSLTDDEYKRIPNWVVTPTEYINYYNDEVAIYGAFAGCWDFPGDPVQWIIRSKDTLDYWSNIVGWADMDSATIFTDSEKQSLLLPIDGDWVRL